MSNTAVVPAQEYQDLIQFMYQSPVGLCQTSLRGAIQFCTPMAAQLLLPLLEGAELSNIFDPLERPAPELRSAVLAYAKKRGKIATEHRCPIFDENGEAKQTLAVSITKLGPDRLAVAISDITPLAASEREAHLRAEMMAAIAENIRGYEICALDDEGLVAGWNVSGERLSGLSAEEVVGRPFSVLVVEDDQTRRCGAAPGDDDRPSSAIQDDEWRSLLETARRDGYARHEGLRRRKTSDVFFAETIVTLLKGGDGVNSGFSVVTRETSAERAKERALMALAATDPLTGAYNRRGFFDLASIKLKKMRAQHRPISIAVIDLDRFKRLNDTFGHAVGDEALRAMVERATRTIRETDVIGRLGGEEFALLMPGVSCEQAAIRAEELRKAIAGIQLHSDQGAVRFTASIGVAELQGADEDLAIALRRADAALYQAKTLGRDRVERALTEAAPQTAQS